MSTSAGLPSAAHSLLVAIPMAMLTMGIYLVFMAGSDSGELNPVFTGVAIALFTLISGLWAAVGVGVAVSFEWLARRATLAPSIAVAARIAGAGLVGALGYVPLQSLFPAGMPVAITFLALTSILFVVVAPALLRRHAARKG